MGEISLEAITDNLRKRMENYKSSLEPSDDEVSLAYLITKVEELQKENKGLLTTISNMAGEILSLKEQLNKENP